MEKSIAAAAQDFTKALIVLIQAIVAACTGKPAAPTAAKAPAATGVEWPESWRSFRQAWNAKAGERAQAVGS